MPQNEDTKTAAIRSMGAALIVPSTIQNWLARASLRDGWDDERDLRVSISGAHFVVSLWQAYGPRSAAETSESCIASTEGVDLGWALAELAKAAGAELS